MHSGWRRWSQADCPSPALRPRAAGKFQEYWLHRASGQTSPPCTLWLPTPGWAIWGDLGEDAGDGLHLGKGRISAGDIKTGEENLRRSCPLLFFFWALHAEVVPAVFYWGMLQGIPETSVPVCISAQLMPLLGNYFLNLLQKSEHLIIEELIFPKCLDISNNEICYCPFPACCFKHCEFLKNKNVWRLHRGSSILSKGEKMLKNEKNDHSLTKTFQ